MSSLSNENSHGSTWNQKSFVKSHILFERVNQARREEQKTTGTIKLFGQFEKLILGNQIIKVCNSYSNNNFVNTNRVGLKIGT